MPTSSHAYAHAWAAARLPVAYWRASSVTSNDIVLASFPKSGNTWVKFLLAHVLTGAPTNFDKAEAVVPSVGKLDGAHRILPSGGRLIKSHERPRFLPAQSRRPKVLLLVRDGRDVAISYYYHWLRTGDIEEGFDAFFERHLDGQVGPYGSWQAYVRSWLTYSRSHPADVCLLRYEDLLTDPMLHLSRVLETLDLGIPPTAIRAALSANTPEAMRDMEASSEFMKSDSSNSDISFVRSAASGQWSTTLTRSQITAFNAAAGEELAALGYRVD